MNKKLILFLRIIIATILIQTLWYKFTAHPDSVSIFRKVGLEPYGRVGIGVLELVSAILLLLSRTIWVGASLTLGVIGGAIFIHLTQIGIAINNDGGKLFYMALSVFLSSLIVLYDERKNIPFIGTKF